MIQPTSRSSSSTAFIAGLATGIVITTTISCYYVISLSRSLTRKQNDTSSRSRDHNDTTTTDNNNSSCSRPPPPPLPPPKRYGGAIRIKPDMYNQYTQLHDAVWDEVLDRMSLSNIRNFTIYYHEETQTLFSHFEWIGHWHHLHNTTTNDDKDHQQDEKTLFQQDMDAISNDPIIRKWWSYCEPCQIPFSQYSQLDIPPPSKGGGGGEGKSGDWWAPLVCLCHCGHWPTSYTSKLRDPDWEPKNPHGKISTSSNPPC